MSPGGGNRVLVVGQGYVGLPLALRAVEVGFDVTGFDVDDARVGSLQQGRSHIGDVTDDQVAAALTAGRYRATCLPGDLHPLDVAVITVPTPLTDGVPDLRHIESAGALLGPLIRPVSTVILESTTTYPGTTDELLAPILEAGCGLKAGVDFHLGYSPERINPGGDQLLFVTTPKVVADLTPDSAIAVTEFYSTLVNRVAPVSTTRVAELTRRGARAGRRPAIRFGTARGPARRRAAGRGRRSHALRLGPGDGRAGFLPMPGGGPRLTWRALSPTVALPRCPTGTSSSATSSSSDQIAFWAGSPPAAGTIPARLRSLSPIDQSPTSLNT